MRGRGYEDNRCRNRHVDWAAGVWRICAVVGAARYARPTMMMNVPYHVRSPPDALLPQHLLGRLAVNAGKRHGRWMSHGCRTIALALSGHCSLPQHKAAGGALFIELSTHTLC